MKNDQKSPFYLIKFQRPQKSPKSRQSPTKIFVATEMLKIAKLATCRQIWQHCQGTKVVDFSDADEMKNYFHLNVVSVMLLNSSVYKVFNINYNHILVCPSLPVPKKLDTGPRDKIVGCCLCSGHARLVAVS